MRYRHIAAVFALSVAMTACAPSDKGVTETVKSKLGADDFIRTRVIGVDTKDHVVTLSGEVRSEQEKTIAIDIARQTTGVKDVVDNLRVAPELETAPTTGQLGEKPDAAARVSGDKAITTDVTSKLSADPSTAELKIDVETKDGVVTLKGDVATQDEHDRVVDITRKAASVTGVDDQLKIKRPRR